MSAVLIRDLDERVLERLKQNARRNGRSLQSEIKRILEEHSSLNIEEFAEISRQWHERLAGRDFGDSAEEIRADREDPNR